MNLMIIVIVPNWWHERLKRNKMKIAQCHCFYCIQIYRVSRVFFLFVKIPCNVSLSIYIHNEDAVCVIGDLQTFQIKYSSSCVVFLFFSLSGLVEADGNHIFFWKSKKQHKMHNYTRFNGCVKITYLFVWIIHSLQKLFNWEQKKKHT